MLQQKNREMADMADVATKLAALLQETKSAKQEVNAAYQKLAEASKAVVTAERVLLSALTAVEALTKEGVA